MSGFTVGRLLFYRRLPTRFKRCDLVTLHFQADKGRRLIMCVYAHRQICLFSIKKQIEHRRFFKSCKIIGLGSAWTSRNGGGGGGGPRTPARLLSCRPPRDERNSWELRTPELEQLTPTPNSRTTPHQLQTTSQRTELIVRIPEFSRIRNSFFTNAEKPKT